MTVERFPLVVGVDESASSALAVNWALEEARARAVPVRVIYAYGAAVGYSGLPMYGNPRLPELSVVHQFAVNVLAKVAAHATEVAPDVEVSTCESAGDPARVLIEESTRASTIVLGSRQLGAVGSVLLGSVSPESQLGPRPGNASAALPGIGVLSANAATDLPHLMQ